MYVHCGTISELSGSLWSRMKPISSKSDFFSFFVFFFVLFSCFAWNLIHTENWKISQFLPKHPEQLQYNFLLGQQKLNEQHFFGTFDALYSKYKIYSVGTCNLNKQKSNEPRLWSVIEQCLKKWLVKPKT